MSGLSRELAREIDRRAVDEYGLPSIVLMENAGRGITDWLIAAGYGNRGPIVICCGPGNNGGDGFVVARHLDLRRASVRVCVFAELQRYQGDAAVNLNVLRKTSVRIDFFGGQHDDARLAAALTGAGCIVDALLGTGFQGEVRVPLAGVIDQLNASGLPMIAIDLPSGLDCNSGAPSQHTIRARQTLTFVAPKLGFESPASRPFTGSVQVLDIGAPRRLIDEVMRRQAC